MQSRTPALLFTFAILCSTVSQAKGKKLQVSEVFQNAHAVYVESTEGDLSRPGVRQADRDAALQVLAALKDWNRYSLAASRDQADLVIVVRKGHAVGDQDHLGLGPQPKEIEPPPPPGQPPRLPHSGLDTRDASASMGGDAIAEQDMLRVYTVNEKGKLKGPVWSREMDGGLNGPSVRLLQELKAAVELTYPMQAAAQPAP